MDNNKNNININVNSGYSNYFGHSNCINSIVITDKTKKPNIKKVIFHSPATIVYWCDNSKTVVKAYDEEFDKEKGLAMAIAKKYFEEKENPEYYHSIFKKWCK